MHTKSKTGYIGEITPDLSELRDRFKALQYSLYSIQKMMSYLFHVVSESVAGALWLMVIARRLG